MVTALADNIRVGAGLAINRFGNMITITLQQRPILRRGGISANSLAWVEATTLAGLGSPSGRSGGYVTAGGDLGLWFYDGSDWARWPGYWGDTAI